MNVQISWQGADSILAAPLVIDLARLVELAMERGESGVLGHLGLFFKDPIGCGEHSLERQLMLLCAHLEAA
jgi:myo-inositol-1-phosphate synthase